MLALSAPAMMAVCVPWAARAQPARFAFDQAGGRVGFTARFGLLPFSGRFDRFEAALALDPAAPAGGEVSVSIQTAYLSVPLPGAADRLRGEPYFDVAHHPAARFTGRVEGSSAEAFAIHGTLRLRGVERPLVMQGRARRQGAATAFAAAGELRRSEFGMVEDPMLISDRITLSVSVRLAV